MNTAVKSVMGGVMFPWYGMAKLRLSFSKPMMVVLSLSIILTALGVVYVKDENRRLFIQYQSMQSAAQAYEVSWGQLLLEQSTWDRQSRIEEMAQQELNMIFPDPGSIRIINIPHQISPVYLSKNTHCQQYSDALACAQDKAVIDT